MKLSPVFLSLSKIALKFAIDKTLEKALPKIYERLDTRIPLALSNGASPLIIKQEIDYAIRQVIGNNATPEMTNIVTKIGRAHV